MKKEDFIKLGLDEETAEKAAAASAEELKGFVPLTRFNEVNEAKKHAEDSIKERDKQIEGLKSAAGDTDTLKKQIETLQAENKQKDAAHKAEMNQLRLDNAVDAAATAAGAKNLKAVKALLDMTKVKLNEDGSTDGLKEQFEALQKAADSSFLFNTAGAPKLKGAKSGENGVERGDDKPDLSTMSYEEICQYLEENPDAQI